LKNKQPLFLFYGYILYAQLCTVLSAEPKSLESLSNKFFKSILRELPFHLHTLDKMNSLEDKFLSSDSDKSLSEDGMNLSLTVASQNTLSELRGLSSRGSPFNNGECSPSPDADVSSNCGTDDSAESSGPSEGMLQAATSVLDPKVNLTNHQSQRGSSSDGTTTTESLDLGSLQEKEELPYPLTNETLEQAMAELPAGARLVRTLPHP
jgi:hypothetical protein